MSNLAIFVLEQYCAEQEVAFSSTAPEKQVEKIVDMAHKRVVDEENRRRLRAPKVPAK